MASSCIVISCKDSDSDEEDCTYQVLSEIQTSMNAESDYEYPTSLDKTPMCPGEPKGALTGSSATGNNVSPLKQSSASLSEQIEEAQTNTVPPPAAPDSDNSDLEDMDKQQPHVIIRQARGDNKPLENGLGVEVDDKIIVRGNLLENKPPLSFKSQVRLRSVSQLDEVGDQGIYQGLVMTDSDKQRLGIVPESIYMTTNLLHSLTSVDVENTPVTFNEGEGLQVIPRLGSKTDPTITVAKIKRHQRASAPLITINSSAPLSVVPRYHNHLVRPPPLPPIVLNATLAERKAYSAVEAMLKSEASLLSSLHIAIKVYMHPLKELSLGPSPILNQQQVTQMFGPIEQILAAQEVFYSALTSRTLNWHTEQKIGDILLSSLNTKEVIKQYSAYVNNFTGAMSLLEQTFKKKSRFVTFVGDKYQRSNTSLSLQGLLLKPVQRFPQYILFIQDLLKYTPYTHPDRITLQMALARFEGIADYLNESKRLREQKSVVEFITTKVSKLPFKLTDCRNRLLQRQDVVTRLFESSSKVVGKQRFLLLFNNMILCAAPSNRRSRQMELESTTGSRFFSSIDGSYTCKWYCPLDVFQIIEADYHNDIWDKFADLNPDLTTEYKELKSSYRQLEQDYTVMTKIANAISSFHAEYEGLTLQDITMHLRVLQRKLARTREQIISQQTGRLDINIPSRDGSRRVNHTYMFQSNKIKADWINAFRYTNLKSNKPNHNAWVTSEDTNDEDFFDLSHKLPLFVDSYRLSMIQTLNSVQFGIKVGLNSAWLASGNDSCTQIVVVECVTPTPLILESFNLNSGRVTGMVYIPVDGNHGDLTITATMTAPSLRDTLRNMGSLTLLPPHLATVWLGTESGRLVIYSAESIEDGTKKHLASINFPDAITTLQYHKRQVIVTSADGNAYVFKQSSLGWSLKQRTTITVSDSAIRCSCLVKNRLWIGVDNYCYFLNLQTLKLEGRMKMSSKPTEMVSRMVSLGEGVWVSFKGCSTLELFHTVTKASLQQIDIKSTLNSIIKRRDLHEKYPVPNTVHVTALMAASGYFWIGTSAGVLMVYRIPLIEGIPFVSAKPFLSMDGHKGPVRVILTVTTQATVSSSRVMQFLSAEQRNSDYRHSSPKPNDTDDVDMGRPVVSEQGRAIGAEDVDGELLASLPPRLNSSAQVDLKFTSSEDNITYREKSWEKSTTPSLPNPSSFDLSIQEDALFTPAQSNEEESDNQSNDGQEVDGENVSTNTESVVKKDDTIVRTIPIPVTNIEQSLDYVEQHYEFSEAFRRNHRAQIPPSHLLIQSNTLTTPSDNGHPDVHHLKDLEESQNARYSPLSEVMDRHYLKRDNTAEAIDRLRAKDIYVPFCNSIDSPYDDPLELDTVFRGPTDEEAPVTMRRVPSDEEAPVTMRRVPSDEEAPVTMRRVPSDEETSVTMRRVPSDEETSVTMRRVPSDELNFKAKMAGSKEDSVKPNPYEDPSTLEHTGPLNATSLFSATMVKETIPRVPGRSHEFKDGAIFVITAGRGLIDLRPGKKTRVLFPTSRQSLCLDDNGEEGSMIAYEIEC